MWPHPSHQASCSSCEATPNQCFALQAVKAVAAMVQSHGVMQLVVDPVLVATSGDSLASSEVAAALKQHLFPLATVITPNLPEASALLDGRPVEDLGAMKQVSDRCAVLCCAVMCSQCPLGITPHLLDASLHLRVQLCFKIGSSCQRPLHKRPS